MKLFRKPKSPFYWYDFTVRGRRYRASTQETKAARAGKIAGLKLAAALQGSDPLDRKAPTLREFSSRFLDWVKSARLENDTQRYYRNGWRLLKATPIAGMKLDHITADDAEALRFPGSSANANNALRTCGGCSTKGRNGNCSGMFQSSSCSRKTGGRCGSMKKLNASFFRLQSNRSKTS